MTPAARKVRPPLFLLCPGRSHLMQVIVAMQSQYRLEEFSEADLLVNITHHTLVPQHIVLKPEEKRELLER